MPTSTRGAIDLPFNEAIDFFRQKVNVPTERWTDMMNEAHSHGFAVAGATNEAMLSDFREAVDKAIRDVYKRQRQWRIFGRGYHAAVWRAHRGRDAERAVVPGKYAEMEIGF